MKAAKVSPAVIEQGQESVIQASLSLIRAQAKLKGELVRATGGARATSTLLGVPLGHNSSYLEGPAFAPPFIRDSIWSGCSNSTTEEGSILLLFCLELLVDSYIFRLMQGRI